MTIHLDMQTKEFFRLLQMFILDSTKILGLHFHLQYCDLVFVQAYLFFVVL